MIEYIFFNKRYGERYKEVSDNVYEFKESHLKSHATFIKNGQIIFEGQPYDIGEFDEVRGLKKIFFCYHNMNILFYKNSDLFIILEINGDEIELENLFKVSTK